MEKIDFERKKAEQGEYLEIFQRRPDCEYQEISEGALEIYTELGYEVALKKGNGRVVVRKAT